MATEAFDINKKYQGAPHYDVGCVIMFLYHQRYSYKDMNWRYIFPWTGFRVMKPLYGLLKAQASEVFWIISLSKYLEFSKEIMSYIAPELIQLQ